MQNKDLQHDIRTIYKNQPKPGHRLMAKIYDNLVVKRNYKDICVDKKEKENIYGTGQAILLTKRH